MKRTLFIGMLGLLASGLVACQQESHRQGAITSTLTVTVPQGISTRAAADYGQGAQVNRCILEIYHDGKLYGERQVATVNGGQATFSDLQLVASQEYNFIFWADCADGQNDKHYNTADLSAITLQDAYMGNNDEFDAFYANETFTVTESFSKNVTLTRPFGQLNVKTNDVASIGKEELKPTHVQMELASVPTTFNLFTEEAGEPQPVIYLAEVEDIDNGELTIDYIWAASDQSDLVDFTMTFQNNGTTIAVNDNFTNIPVRRNYRTNVSGNLITKKGELLVTIDPEFETPDYAVEIIPVETSEALTEVLQNGGKARLANDIELAQSFTVADGADVAIDLAGNTLTFTTSVAMNAENATMSLSNGVIVANNMQGAAVSLFGTDENGEITLDNIQLTTNGSGIGPNACKNGGKVTVRNSTLNCGAYAVSTNASMPVSQNVEIVLENTTMTGSTPICVNIPCAFTMDGCTVTGNTQGMMLRGGTAHISNSHIVLNYSDDDAEDIADYFVDKNWGGGNMVNVAALTVGNKSVGAYQYPSYVELTNTTVETNCSPAGALPALYAWANQGEGLGVTIVYDDATTFNGACIYGSANITVNGEAQNQ